MNFKEKNKAYKELKAKQHALSDLKLLSTLAPNNNRLSNYSRNPEYYAGDILYDLLELSSREDIVKNRRELSSAKDGGTVDPKEPKIEEPITPEDGGTVDPEEPKIEEPITPEDGGTVDPEEPQDVPSVQEKKSK